MWWAVDHLFTRGRLTTSGPSTHSLHLHGQPGRFCPQIETLFHCLCRKGKLQLNRNLNSCGGERAHPPRVMWMQDLSRLWMPGLWLGKEDASSLLALPLRKQPSLPSPGTLLHCPGHAPQNMASFSPFWTHEDAPWGVC